MPIKLTPTRIYNRSLYLKEEIIKIIPMMILITTKIKLNNPLRITRVFSEIGIHLKPINHSYKRRFLIY